MGAGECWIFDTWRRHRVLNEGSAQRIHLVADTVGGERFWDLLSEGRAPGQAYHGEWRPRLHPPVAGKRAKLDFEQVNAPAVMSPWEVREHMVFLLGECVADPRLGAIQAALLQVPLERLEVDVRGRIDPRAGTPGHESTPIWPHDIRYEVQVASPASDEELATLFEAVERNCPILNLLRNPQQIQGTLVRQPLSQELAAA